MNLPPASYDMCLNVRPGESIEAAAARHSGAVGTFVKSFAGYRIGGFMPCGVNAKGEAVMIVHFTNVPVQPAPAFNPLADFKYGA